MDRLLTVDDTYQYNHLQSRLDFGSHDLASGEDKESREEERIEARERIERRRLTQLGRFDACPGMWMWRWRALGDGMRWRWRCLEMVWFRWSPH